MQEGVFHLQNRYIYSHSDLGTIESRRQLLPLIFEGLSKLKDKQISQGLTKERHHAPYGDIEERLLRQEVFCDAFKYDRDQLFMTHLKSRPAAIREKFYISKEFFEKHMDSSPSQYFQELRRLFVVSQKALSELSHQLQLAGDDSSDHLMLIRYSLPDKIPDDTSAEEIHRFGSEQFGVGHDDETFCSLHLGETHQELQEWDYELNRWIPANFRDQQAIFLMGLGAILYRHYPSFHGLVANTNFTNQPRYSLIMERPYPGNFFSNTDTHHVSLDLHKQREKHTCVVVVPSEESDEERLRLTVDYIKSHLFFYLDGQLSKVLIYEESPTYFQKLKRRGYEKVLLVPEGLLLEGEEITNRLLLESERFFKHFTFSIDGDLPQLLRMFDLREKKAKIIDEVLTQEGFSRMFRHTPNILIMEDHDRFAYQVPAETQSLIKMRKDLEAHLRSGFHTPFLFNTEFYTDIDHSLFLGDSELILGLASGFKLNYLAEKNNRKAKRYIFADLNSEMLNIKKRMFESWDGQDFPRWVNEVLRPSFPLDRLYEKNEKTIKRSWERELIRWGGEDNFKDHWTWFRSQDVDFIPLDYIHEPSKLCSLLENQKGAVWVSNIWHNEFVAYHFKDKLSEAYRNWIELIEKKSPDTVLFQGNVILNNDNLQISGVPLKDLVEKLEEL